MSTYLDTLWGAENVPWSMYYLNGQRDNSLVLILPYPLKISPPDLKNRPSATLLIHVVQRCCNKPTPSMNAKVFNMRRLAWQNGHYFTLRTTFNQPGHLATVVAFDLPINDLIPPGMPLDSFRLEPDATATGDNDNEKEGTDSVSIHFNSTKIEISSALNFCRYATGLAGSLWHLTAGYVAKHLAATVTEHRFAGAGVIWLYHIPAISPAAVQKASPARRSITNCAVSGQSMKR